MLGDCFPPKHGGRTRSEVLGSIEEKDPNEVTQSLREVFFLHKKEKPRKNSIKGRGLNFK